MKKGFTLIELLVVISIIGILIGLSVFGLQGAREASRDARRKSDLEEIRSGLEIYKADCGQYPISSSDPAVFSLPLSTSLAGDNSSADCPSSNVYVANVPTDPISSQSYSYISTDGVKYYLCAALEQIPSPPVDISNCGTCAANGSPAVCNYVVKNP